MKKSRECGECAGGGALCDEARIRAAFAGTRSRLEKEQRGEGGQGRGFDIEGARNIL